ELVHSGDEITVKILKFDREKGRVSLGMKQLEPDPWLTVRQYLAWSVIPTRAVAFAPTSTTLRPNTRAKNPGSCFLAATETVSFPMFVDVMVTSPPATAPPFLFA